MPAVACNKYVGKILPVLKPLVINFCPFLETAKTKITMNVKMLYINLICTFIIMIGRNIRCNLPSCRDVQFQKSAVKTVSKNLLCRH
jgi:hypothetical protein